MRELLVLQEIVKTLLTTEGMKAENAQRDRNGQALAYGEEAFFDVSDTMERNIGDIMDGPSDDVAVPSDPIDLPTDAPPIAMDYHIEFVSGTYVDQRADGDYAFFKVKYRCPTDGLIRFLARNASSSYTSAWEQGTVKTKAGEGTATFSHKIVGANPTTKYELTAQLYDEPNPPTEERPVASVSKTVNRTISA